MRVTKIEKQKKYKKRYNIFLDNKFWLGIDEDILIRFALHKGQDLNQTLMEEIMHHESINKHYLKAVNYLSFGLRSIHEMRQYLDKHIDDQSDSKEDNINWIIQKLIQQSYLNDQVYGEAYVRTMMRINRKGPLVIQQELLQKGLDRDLVKSVLNEYPLEIGKENLYKLIEKFVGSKRKLPLKMVKTKLLQHLQTKGYPLEWIQMIDLDKLIGQWHPGKNLEVLDHEARKIMRSKQRKYTGQVLKQRVSQSLFQKGFDYQDIQAWLDNHYHDFEE